MPYDWEGNWVESKADRHADSLGIGEIGGIGQLIYRAVRFKEYEYIDGSGMQWLAHPVCNKKSPPEIDPEGDLTGRTILTSLCNLAKQIDDYEEKDSAELIIKWCKENMHPYGIDELYKRLNEADFDISGFDAELIERDGTFSVTDFMKELGDLYAAVRFYIALNAVAIGEDEEAFEMAHEGRHFATLPYLERYLHREPLQPDIDVSSAGGDLLKEMQLYREYLGQHPEEEKAGQYKEPYDDFDSLRERLIECIPDFRLRLKLDPKSEQVVFAADVSSVFDIAWYTFARLLTEDPSLECLGSDNKRHGGIMICCHHCGQFFYRKAKHQQYCDRPECQKARNAKNQRVFRKRKSNEKSRKEKKRELGE